MQPNKIKRIWSENRPVLNGWLSISSPFAAEVMASQGFDSLTIDIQHGVIDYAGAVAMLQAIRASGVAAMARVPWLEPGIIMKMLDAGACGIICPMINNREQAERFAGCMRYPPVGMRSFGPTRANFAAGPDYYSDANDQVLCIAMIETAEAMENLGEIVATPGIDGVYIGPADLALGVTNGRLPPGFDREEPEMIEAIKTILKAAKSAGIKAGLHCGSPEYVQKIIGWGFDFATISNDVRLLAGSAGESVARTRQLLGESAPEAAGGKDGNKGGY